MANKPFDQRVIYLLERPTSSDLNIAQSQLNLGVRAFARQLMMQNPAFLATGSVGESFFVEAAGGRDVLINRGIGFNYASENAGLDQNIGGVTGLSDTLDYRMVTLQTEGGVRFTIPDAPPAGQCRRDLIAILCTRASASQLKDAESTDIYNPPSSSFGPDFRNKTLSYDLTGAVPQVLNYTDSFNIFTDSVVYVTGQVVTYTGPDSLLNAPRPNAPIRYLNIGVINVVGGQPSITASDIVDFRRLVSPQGNLVVNGSATIGSSGIGNRGGRLEEITLKTPPGIRAQLWKTAEGTSNSYAIVVYGPRNVTSASLCLQRADPASRYELLVNNISGFSDRPIELVAGPRTLNNIANDEVKTIAASSSASPAQQIAVGQSFHFFPFTLCRVDNEVSSVTEPLTLDLNINPLEIPDPPGYPSQWPAGTRSVENFKTTQTFYMNWDQLPNSPTTELVSPSYYLNDIPSQLESTYSATIPTGTTRIAGFVTALSPVQNKAITTGVWRLSLNMASQSDDVAVVAKAYLYNGSTNPELGVLIGESDETYIYDGNGTPRYQNLYIPVVGPTSIGSNRVYIVLYAINTAPGAQGISIKFNGGSPAVVETNILITAPTVTIQQSGDNYPAGTYEITGSATSTPVTINVAGQLQRLNPGALVGDIPINFTLNLTVE